MTRFLLATVASNGHLLPVLPIVERLVSNEHDVAWITGRAYATQVTQAGARFIAMPANVRKASFIPFEHLMPHVDVMISNGGYGGTQAALAHGVPLVVAGIMDDKMEVSARVAWTGAGINLRTRRPKPAALRRAVQAILAKPEYKRQAQRIGEEFAHYDTSQRAVELLEGLVQ